MMVVMRMTSKIPILAMVMMVMMMSSRMVLTVVVVEMMVLTMTRIMTMTMKGGGEYKIETGFQGILLRDTTNFSPPLPSSRKR